MCQLLGVSSHAKISAHVSLSGFFQRAGNTDAHSDGWGVALFNDDYLDIRTDTTAAATCSKASYLVKEKPKASTIIGHIRKATYGKVAPENTHPFTQELWGERWVFSHNGDLHNFYPHLRDQFKPLGDTDSERAFGLILQHWADEFGDTKPSYEALANSLSEIATHIRSFGNFNILLSNGDWLLVHCSSELYWTYRSYPHGCIELLDSEIKVDLSQFNDPDDAMVLIVTRPLTRGEAWYPLGRGEIHVYQQGERLLLLEPQTHEQPEAAHWDAGFDQGLVHFF